MVSVYMHPGCPAGIATVKELETLGAEFEVITVIPGTPQEAELRAEGFLELPIVKTEHLSWTGFQKQKLRSLHLFA